MDAAIEEGFEKLRDEANIPGFRRGRVPMRLIEKRFGQGIRDEVRGQIITESYTQAMEDLKLDVLGEPAIKDMASVKMTQGEPLKFSVEVEVIPEFTLPPLKGMQVEKPIVAVVDADVEEEIDLLRARFGKVQPLNDPAQAMIQVDDYAQGDLLVLAGLDAGEGAEVLAAAPGTYVKINGESLGFKGHVAGILVDDLGQRLLGKKPGETVVISMTGPAGHENEKVRGQAITLKLTLTHVHRVQPASMDEVAPHLGADNEQDARAKVREVLEARVERRQLSVMREQVARQLLDATPMDLPAGLSGRQTERVLHRKALDLAYKGVPEEKIQQSIAEMRGHSEEEARLQLKLSFIMDRVSRELGIEVEDVELNQQVAMLAFQQGRRPEKLRQEMQRRGQLEQLWVQIRDQKALDRLIADAALSERTLTDEPAPTTPPAGA